MAYKNSGAMKFNDATDLVIRADPDGTVESVFNKADNTEYIGPYTPAQKATLTIESETAANRLFYYNYVDSGGNISANTFTIRFGMTNTITDVALAIDYYTSSVSKFVYVSGDAIVNENHIILNGDATVKLVDI